MSFSYYAKRNLIIIRFGPTIWQSLPFHSERRNKVGLCQQEKKWRQDALAEQHKNRLLIEGLDEWMDVKRENRPTSFSWESVLVVPMSHAPFLLCNRPLGIEQGIFKIVVCMHTPYFKRRNRFRASSSPDYDVVA